MVRIAAIDDEKKVTDVIKTIIDNYFIENKDDYELKTYNLPGELRCDLEDGEYFDIYLIDVEMPTVTGLELAQEIRLRYEIPFIIFVTSYMQYCIKGYEYHAWRYITKDVMAEEIPLALESILEQIKSKEYRYYIIETTMKTVKMNYDDIYYLVIKGKYTNFYTRQGVYKERKTLKDVHIALDSNDFIFVNKSYVVNLRHVMSMDKRMLLMRDQETIEVSYPQVQKVKKTIVDFWREK